MLILIFIEQIPNIDLVDAFNLFKEIRSTNCASSAKNKSIF